MNVSEIALGQAHKSAEIYVSEMEGAYVDDDLCRNDSNNEASADIKIVEPANEDFRLHGSVVDNYFRKLDSETSLCFNLCKE